MAEDQQEQLPTSFLCFCIPTASYHQVGPTTSFPSLAMAEDQQQQLPTVLLLRPNCPYESLLSRHFHLLKPHQSPRPLPLFLADSGTDPDHIRAVVLGWRRLSAEDIAALPCLELVVADSAGVNHIDLGKCREKGIRVTNAGSAFSEDVADYAVALLIDVLRGVSAADRYVRSGGWPAGGDFSLRFKLGGKRVGIVGLGSIGSKIAKRLEAFGCIVSYNSRQRKSSAAYPFFSNVCDLAAESDVLILCCALNEQTHHIINKDVMDALGKNGVVINVGRGALIDEKELVQYLMQGKIGGAGFDVYENEPAVPQELYTMNNVVLSPHRAMLTPDSFDNVGQVVLANLKAFFANKPLLSPVALE